ncbi:hypothetical protein [Rubinisphaera italica]|uniref:Neutral/alkaline non-lysosomal ceramidase n=1 Tax=Rubinisphaera italica TaxID=2527969 RepID=A0A5C5XCD3_9PLAN|nr:hypothetical protein [Rubinisphaera italica]TWT60448.1 hypothetical protein Pan54_11620 [Rubinisphaera italica]
MNSRNDHLIFLILTCVASILLISGMNIEAADLRVATFNVDASPPVGSPLAYDPTIGIQEPLSCRGVVLLGSGQPIVLCSVDWIGISNGGQTRFKEELAEAAGTIPERVSVHTIHQHDAPRCDFSAEALLNQSGASGVGFDPRFAMTVIKRAAGAIEEGLQHAVEVTHFGFGEAEVKEVASNRRILGPDGKVLYTRYTATADPKIRAFPVGTIDPLLKTFVLYNGDQPIVVMTYYATHPQSYYRTGLANPDFPGMARNAREKKTEIPHIHFNGAGGNIGAGKWNDGSHENRQVLADKVEKGMEQAWNNIKRSPLSSEQVSWKTEAVQLPVATHLVEEELVAVINDQTAKPDARYYSAKYLAWLRSCQAGEKVDIGCLSVGDVRILHMPGELFVEYQLAAQKMRPDLHVLMAAYGEYAPGYIGTKIAYSQGGYEASDRASRVTEDVEAVLMEAMQKLLK